MIVGLYTGASGMIAAEAKVDVIANTLANINQTGYKRDIPIFKEYPKMTIHRLHDDFIELSSRWLELWPKVGPLGTGVEVNEKAIDFAQGPLKETTNRFDFAIEGKGFFAVNTPEGELFTRNGSFTVNKFGYLTTLDGYQVLGEKGAIKVDRNNFIVGEDGRVRYNKDLVKNDKKIGAPEENLWTEPEALDALKIVDFKNTRQLEKVGNSFYRPNQWSEPPVKAGDFKLRQGFIEQPNLNIVEELVHMISANRAYEMNSRVVLNNDNILNRAINEVGRVG